jgi:hypothetical protein
MKIGGFLVLRVERPGIFKINGGMDLKETGISHLNNGRGLFGGGQV